MSDLQPYPLKLCLINSGLDIQGFLYIKFSFGVSVKVRLRDTMEKFTEINFQSQENEVIFHKFHGIVINRAVILSH